jgi:hypothetical protein
MANMPRCGERGGARLKLLLVLAILGAVAYAGYLYVPVAYQAYLFKDFMQQNVNAASALGRPPSWVGDQLAKSAPDYGVPADAIITPTQQNDRTEVRVQFTRLIEFPGYTYEYEFDQSAKSSEFLTRK